ncbi:MAG TPA: murein biosynthesis integral membrane protein MurJ [Chthonomonadales bacterium]|nr:murein biosynthesis integral membrane protein MurJ [Chthonomonadales bacterium]
MASEAPSLEPSAARRVASATGIMMAAILASRLLGLIRDAVISALFGQGYWSDIYYAAFLVPDLLFFLIAGGALSSAFIPVFTEKLTRGDTEGAWRLFSTIASVMFVVVSAFVVAGEVFAVPLVALIAGGFDPSKAAATAELTRIVLPAQICFFLGGLMMGVQNAHGRFWVPALGPIVYNLGIIAGGVALAPWLGPAGLCWGALAGAVVGNFALQAWAVRRLGGRFRLRFDARSPDAMRVWRLMLPVVLGLALPQVSILINRAFASALGDGPISAITRANMLMQVPLGVFAQALGVAILPTLSAQAAAGQITQLRATAAAGVRTLLFLTIPASALMVALAEPIVRMVLEQGLFGPQDTRMAATALVYYSVGIFAWSAHAVLARGFYAVQDTRTPVVIGTAVTLVFVPMNWLFMAPLGLGYRGLALATTIAAILHMLVMQRVLSRRLGGFEEARLVSSLARTVPASALAAAAAWGARVAMERALAGGAVSTLNMKLETLAVLAVASGAGVLVYAGTAALLRSEELRYVRSLLSRRRPGQTEPEHSAP